MARTVNYVTEEDLAAFLTQRDLIDCLDDDGDGAADAEVVTACIEAAGDEIDASFSLRGLPVPLDLEVETGAGHWAKYLFVAHAFARRHMPPERSGHGEMIKTVREILRMIATRKMSPASAKAVGTSPGAVPAEGNAVDVVSEEALCVPRRAGVVS